MFTGIIGNLLDAITGILKPLMSLSLAVNDFAALLQRFMPGVNSLWDMLSGFLRIFGL
jgi:hypothetical protein